MGKTNGKNAEKTGMRGLLFREKDVSGEARKVARPLAENFPFVFELLGGLEADGEEPEVSPGTVTIFIHEGKARFSANVKSLKKTFIGDVDDVVNPWAAINTALAMGDYNEKAMREQGYTPKDTTGLL